jgi:hypothetical protein
MFKSLLTMSIRSKCVKLQFYNLNAASIFETNTSLIQKIMAKFNHHNETIKVDNKKHFYWQSQNGLTHNIAMFGQVECLKFGAFFPRQLFLHRKPPVRPAQAASRPKLPAFPPLSYSPPKRLNFRALSMKQMLSYFRAGLCSALTAGRPKQPKQFIQPVELLQTSHLIGNTKLNFRFHIILTSGTTQLAGFITMPKTRPRKRRRSHSIIDEVILIESSPEATSSRRIKSRQTTSSRKTSSSPPRSSPARKRRTSRPPRLVKTTNPPLKSKRPRSYLRSRSRSPLGRRSSGKTTSKIVTLSVPIKLSAASTSTSKSTRSRGDLLLQA